MTELDLKEIIWDLHQRIKDLEQMTHTPYSDLIGRSDSYIDKVLSSIKSGE